MPRHPKQTTSQLDSVNEILNKIQTKEYTKVKLKINIDKEERIITIYV